MKLFTSESVTEGHPDKISDRIADLILDAALEKDPNSRVACEVAVAENYMLIFGEISSQANLNYESIARNAIKEIGYDDESLGFDYKTFKLDVKIKKQSSDIAMGIDQEEQGAGDQGIMFGYANSETKDYLPLAIDLANKLAKRLEVVRKENIIPGLGPDGKTQVTVEYFNNEIKRIHTVVLSTQHRDYVELEDLKKEIHKHVFQAILPANLVDEKTIYLINPTGRFVIGGPLGDAGLTGRKLIVDTYGGYSRHGGGAMSGKDASKVDRCAAYMTRYVAKNVVASKIAKECEIQVAYAIGVAKPVSITVNTYNTGLVSDELIAKQINDNFDFRPAKIIEKFELKKPIFSSTSVYGHFKPNYPWEATDKIAVFTQLL